jgi:hypothetical protein
MFRIPRCLHFDSAVPSQPMWDSLIGICNPFDMAVTVTIRCYDTAGEEVPGSPLQFTLQPGHSLANTFIKGNTLPNPPQNWQGYATIEFTGPFPAPELPTMVCLGGNGPTPLNWNYSTATVPVLGSTQKSIGPGKRWVFPYLIPFFDDPNQHHMAHSYRTGLSITNLDTSPVSLNLRYTVGDTYPQQQQQFTATLFVDAGATVVKQLHELIPELLNFNSEGWLDITSPDSKNLMMYLLCANRDYNYLGFSQSPWII